MFVCKISQNTKINQLPDVTIQTKLNVRLNSIEPSQTQSRDWVHNLIEHNRTHIKYLEQLNTIIECLIRFDWVRLSSIYRFDDTVIAQKLISKYLVYFEWFLDGLIGFDWVQKSNAIALSQKKFCLMVFDYQSNRTQSFDYVRLGSIKFDYRTVRLVMSGL